MSSLEIFCRALPRSVSCTRAGFLGGSDARGGYGRGRRCRGGRVHFRSGGSGYLYLFGLGGNRHVARRQDFELLEAPHRLERFLAFEREFAGVLGQEGIDDCVVHKIIFLGSVRCGKRFLRGCLLFGLKRSLWDFSIAGAS